MPKKEIPHRRTISNVTAYQMLALKKIALDLLGVASVSALVRAIADGTVKVIKSKRKDNE